MKSGLIFLSLVFLSVRLSGSLEAQEVPLRTLKALHVPTNRWLQRIDRSVDKSPGEFLAEVSQTFNLPLAELQIVIESTTNTQGELAAAEMAAGNHQGLPVIPSPRAPPRPPDPRETALKNRIDALPASPELKQILKDLIR